MRSLPRLALASVLGLLLTACPAAGPGLSFTGTYTGTFSGDANGQEPAAALRGFGPGTYTAALTQTESAVTGTFTGPITNTTISATVSQPGVASGTYSDRSRGDLLPINLFLTPLQDLVLHFPTRGNRTVFLERQP